MQITNEELEAALEKDHLPFYLASYEHVTNKKKHINFDQDGYRFQKGIYLDNAKKLVIKKPTQIGISEFIIVRCLASLKRLRHVFCVIPKWELIRRFVKKRFDVSVKNTPYYQTGMDNYDRLDQQSVGLKSLWGANIVFVGSNSESGFAEFVADDVFIDEFDHCSQENLPMAEERQGDSDDPKSIKSGNPTIPNYGISLEYNKSDQKKWNNKHDCGEWINPDFFSHVVLKEGEDFAVIDRDWEDGKPVRAICHKCHKPFNPKGPGEWVSTYSNRDISGYAMNKMFAGRRDLDYMLERFMEGLVNERVMERFYNADLGLEYTSAGAKVSFDMLDDISKDYPILDKLSEGTSVMGVDVGNQLHIRINEILPDKEMREVYTGTIQIMSTEDTIDAVKRLWKNYRCRVGVIDASPERRLARDICAKIKGFLRWQHIESEKDTVNIKDKIISFNRNLLLDDVKESIITKRLTISKRTRYMKPQTTIQVSEYYDNMTASTRMYIEATGKYKWVETRPDHYMFAEGYTILARKMLLTIQGRGHVSSS